MFRTDNLADLSHFRTLVFCGGVYSNLEALQVFRKEILGREISSDAVFCTGDVTAYCADPVECLDEIAEWNIRCIAGNLELQLASGQDNCGCGFNKGSLCNSLSRQWYAYIDKNVSGAHRDWMAHLPQHISFSFGGKKFLVVHGTPTDVSGFVFASTPWAQKRKLFEQFGVDVIVCGHNGVPHIEENEGYVWCNAGVIGMPANDGTLRTWYASVQIDENALRFEHHAIEYESATTAQKMLDRGLPKEYADTILTGLWCSCDVLPDAEKQKRGIPITPTTLQI